MDGEVGSRIRNTNPSRFEELAGVIATAYAYYEEGKGMERLHDDFVHLYRRALVQPPCYSEITEITGQSLTSGDRMAGQAAWMLQKIEALRVYGVHSQLWHEVGNAHSSPLLDQLASALGIQSRLTAEDMRHIKGKKKALVHVVGLKAGDSIWIVQTKNCNKVVDSAVARGAFGSTSLFKSRVFNDPVLDGDPLKSLILSGYFMRKAFPDFRVMLLCMALHPTKPDFELYQVETPDCEVASIKLEERMIRKNSIDFSEELRDDWDALLTLPQKLDNDLFAGLPPCKGGRTLAILASTAKRQLDSEKLLVWKEQEVSRILKQDFGYVLPRDKVRHDLVDRLVGNGFMRKSGSEYSLTMKGMARYLYCLAKYTTVAKTDPEDVIEACKKQRDRILSITTAFDVRVYHRNTYSRGGQVMGNKLNVQFNDRQTKTLEDMAEEMGTTKAGVLKTALALLEVAIRERKDGNSLGVVKGDKVVKEIIGIE